MLQRARSLMLQTVLGVDAARIASALLISPAATGQRLVPQQKEKSQDYGQSAGNRDGHLNSGKSKLYKPTSWY